jgi:SAM-dependent MidA family methyltransferase
VGVAGARGQGSDPSLEWPAPDGAAAVHSARLGERIRAEVAAAGGAIGFARFMDLALYAPGLGYYSSGTTKLGRGGDFTTAPEISSLFGRCLARQISQILPALGCQELLELGAGTGRLTVDVLLSLETQGVPSGQYRILEVSADLRARQRQTIEARAAHLLPRVQWLDALPGTPFKGVILANEVIDAMPVDLFELQGERVCERRVGWEEAAFAWVEGVAAPPALAARVGELQASLGYRLPEGYRSEVNLRLAPWIRALGDSLDRGVMLFTDYGYTRREYYHPERREGTLTCHYRHRVHADPLILPGLQDITSFVDYTALAEAAHAAGLTVLGYTTQAHFLIGCGLEQLLEEARSGDSKAYFNYVQEAKRLTLPGEMGERFKVMALGKGWDSPLAGFGVFDQRHRL